MAKKQVVSKWFEHPESGQVFEATGIEIYHAERHGCIEIPAPKPAPPVKEKPVGKEKDNKEKDNEENPKGSTAE